MFDSIWDMLGFLWGASNMRFGERKPTTCPEGEHKNFNHCLCEHREEEQLKHFTPDSYVIIENSKPDVTGEATAKTESVYWKKLPLSASNSENFNNPRLKIKEFLPSLLIPESSLHISTSMKELK
ncbi:uncharacterized protein TNCT_329592 [Trichonephila clavata]|uniref:Uncharacterized protein n=1 Tax=Trichonephila clavata TaxID=2740835 RepID=A0A8X6M0S8_TRICU|nr:uncharacterized protein TNCT_329592 [Trichonephila clavata]